MENAREGENFIMHKQEIAFMFGAGAEVTEKNFNIRNGYEYLISTLCTQKSDTGYTAALKEFFDGKYYDDSYVYFSYTIDATSFMLRNFLIKKSLSDKNFFNTYKNDICEILSDEELKPIKSAFDYNEEYTKNANSAKSLKDDLKKELKKILSKEKTHKCDITSSLLKDLFEESEINGEKCLSFDINVGIGGVPDSYFHTIINPSKFGPKRFSKIFNFYWSCYFTILEDILKFLSDKSKYNFDEYLGDNKINCRKVLQNINELTRELYALDINEILPNNSYYALIREQLNKYQSKLNCCGIITTNYFKFCESVSKEHTPIYLNGELKYFEYPELLEVVNFEKEDLQTGRLVFPFIFSQSLVKPIVNFRQAETFHKLKKTLENADILVILGFNLNEDDNHINAYLHDFVKIKPIIIVTNSENYDAASRLKYQGENIHICVVEYGNNKTVVEKIFKSIQEILYERNEE